MTKKQEEKSFKNPVHRAKAIANSKGKKRPNRIGKKELIKRAKIELLKDELFRDGYLREMRAHFPAILKAHLKMAKSERNAGVQERKMVFEATEVLKDKKAEAVQSIADLLSDLHNMKE